MSTDVEAAAARSTQELAREQDEPLEVELHDDRTQETKTPGFRRMVTSVQWGSEDAAVIASVTGMVENAMMINFADAFQMMNRIYEIVRTPVTDPMGTVLKDRFGYPVWARTDDGGYEEDFSLLTRRDKEQLLFTIHTHLVEWEQRAASMWQEAMFAKGKWEEAYSRGFQIPQGRVTEADRTARGRVEALDDRYSAIFYSSVSRHADALVRTIQLLGQRLKDSLDW